MSDQWVIQLDVYHEWMNEMDYEVVTAEGKMTPTAAHLGEWMYTHAVHMCCIRMLTNAC